MFFLPRKLLIGLLAFGTVAGFGSGFASLKYRMRHGCHRWNQENWSQSAYVPARPHKVPDTFSAPAPPPAAPPAEAEKVPDTFSAKAPAPVTVHVTVNPVVQSPAPAPSVAPPAPTPAP